MSRAQRLVLTFATALCVWLWVGVASAAQEAPRCDHRGATTFAETPAMQPLMRSLDVFSQEEECVPKDHADICGQRRSPAPPPNQVHGDPLLPAPVTLDVPFAIESGTLGVARVRLGAAPAHVGALDRPPRS